ncbi:hypothetical protein HID58_056955 [Brassica napus]|uniref:Uncharacterized protein n=1 Tax=Brassica napus TaxID=3708 RepID=A0ABQ8APR2_BRANA|nr:hypothetical protein HID58_056955 [Brassica napus]
MDNVGFDSIYSYHLHFLVGLILDHNNFDGFMLQLTSLLHWSSLPPQNPSTYKLLFCWLLQLATRVKYGAYITGSLFGMVPEIFVANLYVKALQGNLVKTLLAEASSADEHGLSVTQIYAKRQLETMKKEEEALSQ